MLRCVWFVSLWMGSSVKMCLVFSLWAGSSVKMRLVCFSMGG